MTGQRSTADHVFMFAFDIIHLDVQHGLLTIIYKAQHNLLLGEGGW